MTKRRGRRSSRRDERRRREPTESGRTDSDLELALRRAERWIERDHPERAIDLLEPLVASAPQHPDLRYILGHARASAGDIWGAVSTFEQAKDLSDDPTYLVPLVSLYMEAGLAVHALRVSRLVINRGVSTPFKKEIRQTAVALEQDLAQAAEQMDRPAEQVEQGLYELEQGRRAMSENDFSAAIAVNRSAIEHLGDWPAPHNNLSQALFYGGQPGEAIEEVRRVLSKHPDNLQALANGVRFLSWTGQEEEARELWSRLEKAPPRDASERMKKAEAAAVLAEHEDVYQILKPLGKPVPAEELSPSLMNRAQSLLAVAEANTDRRQQAERRLRALGDVGPLATETLTALETGQSGIGWAQHFRYFHPVELLPAQHWDALLDLLAQEDELPPETFRRRIHRFAERFPQIVEVSERTIWEEQQPEAGIMMLSTMGTPEAYAALRRFAQSQAGDDQARAQALTFLAEAGEIKEDEVVRAWLDGEWRDVQLELRKIPAEMWRESSYSPRVMDTLNRGQTAYQEGDVDRAEELFERVLELDPNVKEAYNNLGTIYAKREEHERARDMFRRAVEIDPLYVFALGNLVNYLLQEERVEEAKSLMDPLSDREDLHPRDMAFYRLTRARILVSQEDYEGAKTLLHTTLDAHPAYEPAQELLEWIEDREEWSYWEEQWERDLAWRERLQKELSTLEPTLAEALPLYTKEALTAMAREVMLWGGWSRLRKAELVDAIIEALTTRENLARVVKRLPEEQRDALRMVLDRGGAVAWEDFDARYGNDLDESRYWHWYTPETTMGQLRLRGLLVEATVDDGLHLAVPVDLREDLERLI